LISDSRAAHFGDRDQRLGQALRQGSRSAARRPSLGCIPLVSQGRPVRKGGCEAAILDASSVLPVRQSLGRAQVSPGSRETPAVLVRPRGCQHAMPSVAWAFGPCDSPRNGRAAPLLETHDLRLTECLLQRWSMADPSMYTKYYLHFHKPSFRVATRPCSRLSPDASFWLRSSS